MTSETFAGMISLLNMAVSLCTLLGVAYALGRILARFDAVEKAIFGGDDQQGIFLRRSEAEILLEKNNQEHEQFTKRLDGISARRIGGGS